MNYTELNEILREYSESPEKSAILLHGEWGSGKTFFVQNVAKKHFEDGSKRSDSQRAPTKVAYCSLNGLRNVDDLFQRLAVSVTTGKLSGTGKKNSKELPRIESLVKEISRMPIVGKYVPLGFFSFISQWLLENMKGVILFLDDLERVNADFRLELMGTVHSLFVEEKGMKVVYLCDESRIDDRNYTEAKEKYISRTFRFQADIPFVYDEFILSPKSPLRHSLSLLRSKRYFVLNEVASLEIKNIRTLLFIVYQIEKMIGLSGEAEVFLSDESVLSALITTSLLYKDGALRQLEDLERLRNQYFRYLMLRHAKKNTEVESKSEYEILQEKYGKNVLVKDVPYPVLKIIFEGYISKTEFEQHVQKIRGTDRLPHERALENLLYFRDLKDEDCQRDLIILLKSAKQGLYSPLEYLHITQILELFKSQGILRGSGLRAALTKGLQASLENDQQVISNSPDAYIDSDRYSFVSASVLASELRNMILSAWESKHSFWQQETARELLARLSHGHRGLVFSREGFQGTALFSKYSAQVYCESLPFLTTAQIYDFGTIIEDWYLRVSNAGVHHSEAVPYLSELRDSAMRQQSGATRFRRAALAALYGSLERVIAHLHAPRGAN